MELLTVVQTICTTMNCMSSLEVDSCKPCTMLIRTQRCSTAAAPVALTSQQRPALFASESSTTSAVRQRVIQRQQASQPVAQACPTASTSSTCPAVA